MTQAEKELLKSNKKKDSKALYFLYQAVHESVFPRIAAAKTSKEVANSQDNLSRHGKSEDNKTTAAEERF